MVLLFHEDAAGHDLQKVRGRFVNTVVSPWYVCACGGAVLRVDADM